MKMKAKKKKITRIFPPRITIITTVRAPLILLYKHTLIVEHSGVETEMFNKHYSVRFYSK